MSRQITTCPLFTISLLPNATVFFLQVGVEQVIVARTEEEGEVQVEATPTTTLPGKSFFTNISCFLLRSASTNVSSS